MLAVVEMRNEPEFQVMMGEDATAQRYLEMADSFLARSERTADPIYAKRLEKMAKHMMEIASHLNAAVS